MDRLEKVPVCFSITKIMRELRPQMDSLQNQVELFIERTQEVSSPEALVLVASANLLYKQAGDIARWWTDYTHGMEYILDIKDETERKKAEELEEKARKYRELYLKYRAKAETLSEEIEVLRSDIEKVQAQKTEEENLRIEKAALLLDMIEDRAGSIAASIQMRDRGKREKGKKGGGFNFREDVKTEDIVADYQQSGRITKDMQQRFGMTYQGIRHRLIDVGVYKGR